MDASERDSILLNIARHRRFAHDFLFSHRHPQQTPEFHYEMIDLIHSRANQNVLFLCFRGSAKSTLQEESAVIQACLGEFRNRVILGSSQTRAIDRLNAIKYELEYNEVIQYLFDPMVGPTWNEDRIVLSNGVCIQAFGPGQSFRGVKHLDWRPDRLDIDDLEDEESIRDPDAREKLRSWLRRVVFPACVPWALKRVYATPLDPDALPMHLARSKAWKTVVVPIYSLDENGGRRASWPDLYPMEWVEAKEREYSADGAMQEFSQEYLCIPEDAKSKVFTEDMLKVTAQVRTWQATYAAYDPARSIGNRSATTGYVVFSWVGRRMVIWAAGAEHWLPDQIVKSIFDVAEGYNPVEIGVETTGLVEFIEQPLRQRAVELGVVLPLRRLVTPGGRTQTEFIRQLQPFFKAGEIEFACAIPDEARSQLLAFPTGRRDFPNALAYAMLMRPGLPVFEGFGMSNIVENLVGTKAEPHWLLVNATAQYTTGVLLQHTVAGLRVFCDWVYEGPPGERLAQIVRLACSECGRTPRVRCPPAHFEKYDLIGLRAAAKKIPIELLPASDPTRGREEIRKYIKQVRQDISFLLVASQARWTLNAFSGGYAYARTREGPLADLPIANAYRVLMEGLESFMGVGAVSEANDDRRYATSSKGRRYLTTGPGETVARPPKSEWYSA